MTSYASETHYLEAEAKSFAEAKKVLKKYRDKINLELYEDFTGDKDKVLDAINEGMKYLELKRKKTKNRLNILKDKTNRL